MIDGQIDRHAAIEQASFQSDFSALRFFVAEIEHVLTRSTAIVLNEPDLNPWR